MSDLALNFDKEIWCDVIGYEGYFRVSNMGRIKSLSKEWMCGHWGNQIRRYDERIKPISFKGDGYGRIILISNGKRKSFLIHRLVAIHFIPNPENKPEVNHKLGDKRDNRASELEWTTASENGKHAFRFGLKKVRVGVDNATSKLVINNANGIFYHSAKEAWVATGANYGYVHFCKKLRGEHKNNTSMVYV